MPRTPQRSIHNRVAAVMEHVAYYGFHGQARLARDAGVSVPTVRRLLAGETLPSIAVALAVAAALERRIGKRLDQRELFSLDGAYPTDSVCALVGCTGCLPGRAYAPDGTLRPEYRAVRPGGWDAVPRP